ncbi:MAG TPA: hypothetical protein PLH65_02450 [bacterium]|nr:hypothetical protein [bacterium]HPN67542.1 hypothetical protein [bacterium]
MDLVQSIKPIIKYWWVILLSVIIVFAGIIITNKMSKASWDGATTLILKQEIVADKSADNYKFDGYYAVEANQIFSDSIETWLEAPDFIQLVYDKAQVQSPEKMSSLKGTFDFDKVISQSVAVRLNGGSKDEVNKLMNAMISVMKEKTESLLVDQDGRSVFTIDSTPVLILQHEVDFKLQFGIGLLGALCMGVFLCYFMYAFDEMKK